MTTRAFVSFEADFPTDGELPGLELARTISEILHKAGISHMGPKEREGWAWDIDSKIGKIAIESIIALSDDGPRQWQIHNYSHPGLLGVFSEKDREKALADFCQAIDRGIKADERFRTIRWYEQSVFEKDHGATWGESP